MKKLNEQEINEVVYKIRKKYKLLIEDFNKSKSILSLFEERYMQALKSNTDLSIFLIAEIEAVEELYKTEKIKQKYKEEEKVEAATNKKSYADVIYEENRKKILNYPRLEIHEDADEEIERLIGACRAFLAYFWPIITSILSQSYNSEEKSNFKIYYEKMFGFFDYKNEAPISRSYKAALVRVPKDLKKVEYEHRYILTESAFLLNEIHDSLDNLLKDEKINQSNEKIFIKNRDNQKWYDKNFNNLTYKESLEKVLLNINAVINDFRIKEIKRSSKY